VWASIHLVPVTVTTSAPWAGDESAGGTADDAEQIGKNEDSRTVHCYNRGEPVRLRHTQQKI
jgi:hypothetical protein